MQLCLAITALRLRAPRSMAAALRYRRTSAYVFDEIICTEHKSVADNSVAYACQIEIHSETFISFDLKQIIYSIFK